MQIADHTPTTEKPKGKRGGARPNSGRPRTREPQPPKGQAFILPALEKPKGIDQFEHCVGWWLKLNEEQLNTMSMYVYRTWPLVDSTGGDPNVDKNLEIMTGPCPFTIENWRTEIMGKWGSGSYMFMIKEGNVHRWTIYANNLRDFQNYPPLIDYRTLMVNDPANKDFVKWARTRGLIKDYNEEDGNGMANAALERMAETTDRLTDKVIDLATAATQRPEGQTVESAVQLKIVEQMNEASTKAIDTVINIMDRQSANKERQTDPLEMVDRVISLTQSLNKGDDKVGALMQQMLDTERRRADRLEERLDRMQADMHATRESEPKGLAASLSGIKELGEVKSLLADLGVIKLPKDSSADEQTEGEGKSKGGGLLNSLIESALRNPQPILDGATRLLGTLVNGVLAMRTQQAAVPAAPAANGQPAAQPQQPIPQVQVPPAPTESPEQQAINNYLGGITPTIIHHLSSESLNGYTFAAWLIDSRADGRIEYNKMKSAGAEIMTELLRSYHPLWDRVKDQSGNATPEFLQFVTEFCTYDTWKEEQERLAEQEDAEADAANA